MKYQRRRRRRHQSGGVGYGISGGEKWRKLYGDSSWLSQLAWLNGQAQCLS